MHLLHFSAELMSTLLVPMEVINFLERFRVLNSRELLTLLVVKMFHIFLCDLFNMLIFFASLLYDGDGVSVVDCCHFN